MTNDDAPNVHDVYKPPVSNGHVDDVERGSVAYLILICFVATLGGLLFGYDTAVIAGAIGFLETHFSLSDAQVGWAAASALAGCVLGAALAGLISDYLGRKKVLILCAVLFVISAIGSALPDSPFVLDFLSAIGIQQPTIRFIFYLFRAVGGIGVGAAAMTSPMYIAEISPAHIRGRMVSLNQLAIVFGMLAVYFVNYFIARSGDITWNVEYGWRWMFASETIPAVILLAFLFLVPESPRWLVKKTRIDEALNVLSRINGSAEARKEIVSIKDAIESESESIFQLFAPGMRIALLIGIMLAVLQQVTGINVFLYFAPEILKKIAGTRADVAMLQTVMVGAVNMVFTVVAIWTVDLIGRKPLMLFGYTGMAFSLFALGLAAYQQQTGVWMLAFMLSYIACFALSVGPVTWVILSEIFPTRIRGRAMAIATVFLWAANLAISLTFPMMKGNKWLVDNFHHAFPFWLYGSLSVVAVIFLFAFVPETKGRTLEEIEQRWMRK